MGYRMRTITREREYGDVVTAGWDEWRDLVLGVEFINSSEDMSYYDAYEEDIKEYIKDNPKGELTEILKVSLEQKPKDSNYVSWEWF